MFISIIVSVNDSSKVCAGTTLWRCVSRKFKGKCSEEKYSKRRSCIVVAVLKGEW